MNFWDVHGHLGGFFFCLFLLVLPRLTILFSVSLSAAVVYGLSLIGLTGVVAWPFITALTIAAWIIWLITPRALIAFLAVLFYAPANYVLCIAAVFIGWTSIKVLFAFVTQFKAHWRTFWAELQKAHAAWQAETERLRKENEEAAEALRRMQERMARMRTSGAEQASLDELLRRIREQQEYMRQQQARQSAHKAEQPKLWYEVLGVGKDASVETIKKAYRDIAKRTHPDAAGADADASKFREAAEAFDEAKKKKGFH